MLKLFNAYLQKDSFELLIQLLQKYLNLILFLIGFLKTFKSLLQYISILKFEYYLQLRADLDKGSFFLILR